MLINYIPMIMAPMMMVANTHKEINSSEKSDREKRKRICTTQKDLFAYAAKLGYDPKTFTNEYLRSEYCAKMFDTIYSHPELPSTLMESIIPEIGEKLIKTDNTDVDLAGYVGYMYRYLYFITPYNSRELIEKVPFDEIAKTAAETSIKDEQTVVEELCIDNNLEYHKHKI